MSDFYRTGMGQTFYQRTMPMIADSLQSIARSLDGQAKAPDVNELTDEELTLLNEAVAAYVECGCGSSVTSKFNTIRHKLVLTQMARKVKP